MDLEGFRGRFYRLDLVASVAGPALFAILEEQDLEALELLLDRVNVETSEEEDEERCFVLGIGSVRGPNGGACEQ